jgi:hypothetical protein
MGNAIFAGVSWVLMEVTCSLTIRTNGKVRIPLDLITKANLEVDVSEELRKGGR